MHAQDWRAMRHAKAQADFNRPNSIMNIVEQGAESCINDCPFMPMLMQGVLPATAGYSYASISRFTTNGWQYDARHGHAKSFPRLTQQFYHQICFKA